MIAPNRFAKTKKPAMGPMLAKNSSSALVEAARRRRQLVLKPIKPDPFLTRAPRPRRKDQQREYIRPPSPVRSCDPKLKPTMVSRSSRINRFGRSVHPNLINVGGGMAANAILAERMPPQLQRPCLQETDPEAITQAGHDAELALKGLEIVRRELIKNGEHLFAAVANTVAEPITATQSSELPGFITIRVPKKLRPEHMPSHMLAVHSSEPEIKLRKVIAVPIHAPILAAHCSRVPPLPSPTPPSPSLDPLDVHPHTHKRLVPLVPFSIPSPDTFPLMTQFLCTQNATQLFQALIPFVTPAGAWFGDLSSLPEYLADAFSGATLISNAMRVYGVWQNACSLGVLNPCVWQVIDVAWKGYRDALLLAQR